MAVTHEPAIYRLNIYHGENLQMHFGYFNPDASGRPDYNSPVDLTGCSAELKVWEPETNNVLLNKSTETSLDIVLGGAEGTIDVDIPSSEINAITATENAESPEYRWSLQITFADGTADIWMYGPCFVVESWVPSV